MRGFRLNLDGRAGDKFGRRSPILRRQGRLLEDTAKMEIVLIDGRAAIQPPDTASMNFDSARSTVCLIVSFSTPVCSAGMAQPMRGHIILDTYAHNVFAAQEENAVPAPPFAVRPSSE